MTKKLKTTILGMVLMFGAVLGFGPGGGQALADDHADIRAAIEKYDQAFNARDVDGIIAAYTADGILMPQNRPAIFSAEKIGEFYANLFEQATLIGKLDLQEIVSMSDDWAFVRTTSVTKITIKANGVEFTGRNQELFILHNDNGWKIARYMFSSTLPSQR